ncbi:MAG TPA: ABC transporter permease [Pirellulales bacterium]|nr:ABC transporter permease [Pirellulales bacterium]
MPSRSSSVDNELIWYAPKPAWSFVDLAELWRYRHLIAILALRDIKVRYRQTMIGVAWALVQPLTQLCIFALLFGLLGRTPVEPGTPFLVSAMCGLLLWQLFAQSVTGASASLLANTNLVTKVYFPRLALPISAVAVALVDFCVGVGLLAALLLWYGVVPGAAILFAPLFVLLAVILAVGISAWLSALSALYRDFQYLVPFLLQIAFFASPVIYQTDALIPAAWRPVFALNPLAGAIEGFRWAVTGQGSPPWLPIVTSIPLMAVVLGSGLLYFRRVERTFADRI